MEITVRCAGGTATVALEGDLKYGAAERDLEEQVNALVAGGERRIVLDLSELRFVDSSGLGSLIRCHRACQAAGADLELLRPRSQLRNLLAVARLDDLLRVVDADGAARLDPSGRN